MQSRNNSSLLWYTLEIQPGASALETIARFGTGAGTASGSGNERLGGCWRCRVWRFLEEARSVSTEPEPEPEPEQEQEQEPERTRR